MPLNGESGLRTRKSFNNRVKLAVLGCFTGGLLLWLTWPTVGQLTAETCAPNGLIAELSASIHGELGPVLAVALAGRLLEAASARLRA